VRPRWRGAKAAPRPREQVGVESSQRSPLESAARWLDRLATVRALCVGDAMLDRTVGGMVERVSPEAPIPVLRMTASHAAPGGAGNVLANLLALGTRAELVAVAGADAAGDQLGALLEALAPGAARLIREPGRPTTVKTRYVAGSQQLLRVDEETTRPIAHATAAGLLAAAMARLPLVDALVLADYAKGVLTGEVVRALITRARGLGKPVLVDPKGGDWRHYRGATVITPNRQELAVVAGVAVGSEAALQRTAAMIRERLEVPWLLTTLGMEGMLLVGEAGDALRIPGIRRLVFDVVGAGDCVVACLAAMTAAGATMAEAAALANLAGSLAVGRPGTRPVGEGELRLALIGERGAGAAAKLLSPEAALRLVREARRQGARIGFTNGCFDVLHPGHVSLIQEARRRCGMLVVGLNGDASVRRLKGPGRPVNDVRTRALVLAAIAGVDAVVEFDEDTPIGLIRLLEPDLLVKGADYGLAQVVGAAEVIGRGGEVFLAPLTPEAGTSATLARIRRCG
jgi:D-beta-D-heptose 7-phosphate kinase/D-beta-D-heptose 1-phosphate adenosyltransferase